ncbi:MAG TPA: AtpZ/AtpI family protein [Patescibacteria group bacterium]|nr:AtpZ/AtpI family protein [Patescibacteria group bacterium]
MPDDLKDFEARLEAFRRKEEQTQEKPLSVDEAKMEKNMNIGMRAGTEFMSHLIAGGVLGGVLDHYLKTSPLFMLLLVFAGFGSGLYRTYSIMNKKS